MLMNALRTGTFVNTVNVQIHLVGIGVHVTLVSSLMQQSKLIVLLYLYCQGNKTNSLYYYISFI